VLLDFGEVVEVVVHWALTQFRIPCAPLTCLLPDPLAGFGRVWPDMDGFFRPLLRCSYLSLNLGGAFDLVKSAFDVSPISCSAKTEANLIYFQDNGPNRPKSGIGFVCALCSAGCPRWCPTDQRGFASFP
jgi:hypothetical protein